MRLFYNYFKKKIYKTYDKDCLLKKYKHTTLGFKIEIIFVLYFLGYNDESIKLLHSLEKDFNVKLQDFEQYHFTKYIIAINKHDTYETDKRIDILNKRFKYNKSVLKYNSCKTIFEQNKIYREKICCEILDNNKYQKNLHFYIIAYLIDQIYNKNHIKIQVFEEKINNYFKKIKGIYQIDVLHITTNMIDIIYKLKSNQGVFINDFDLVIKNYIEFVESSLDYFQTNMKKKFIEIICEGYIILINNYDEKKYTKILDDFVENNKDFVPNHFIIFHSLKHKENLSNVNNIIKDNDKSSLEIMLQVKIYKKEYDHLKKIYNNYKYLENKNVDLFIIIKTYYYLMLFLTGKNVDFNDLPLDKIRVNDLYLYLNQFENKLIPYLEFINKISNLNNIELNTIDFNRLSERLLYYNDIKWLFIILERIPLKSSDDNIIFEEFVIGVCKAIVDNKIIIDYSLFNKLSELILFKLDSLTNLLCLYHVYIMFKSDDDFIRQLACNILGKLILLENKIRIHIHQIINIVYHYISYNPEREYSYSDFMSILDNIDIEDDNLLNLKLLLGFKVKEFWENNYIDILKELQLLYEDNKEFSEITIQIISIYNMINLENEIEPVTNKDEVFYNENKYYGIEKDFINYYNVIGIEYQKLKTKTNNKYSLINIFLKKIFFKHYSKFNLIAIPISETDTGIEIINKIDQILGVAEKEDKINQILEGKLIIDPQLNLFDTHYYFKITKKLFSGTIQNKLLTNQRNILIPNVKKIIHPTAVILLGVLDSLDVIDKNKSCFITSEFYFEIKEMKEKNIIHLEDGISKDVIYYEDTLEKVYNTINQMSTKGRVLEGFNGNIYPTINTQKFLNKYDNEILKIIKENPNCIIITNDFNFYPNFLRGIVFGIYTLLIEAYTLKIITCETLKDKTQQLKKMGYKALFDESMILGLTEMTKDLDDDEEIEDLIKILID